MKHHVLSIAAGAVVGLFLGFAPAQAAPVLGSHVDSSVFSASLGSTSGWSYLGQSTSAFSGTGTATVVHRSSSYSNSFGYSAPGYGSRVQVFGAGAGTGSTAAVTGYDPSYLLYFQADGADLLFFSDDNRQFSDGHATGGNPGASQGDIDIFKNAATSTWAFFFDDAGGGLFIAGDDNDYDDLVVTFAQRATDVPEPASLLLLGGALLGFAGMRRKKAAQLSV